MKLNYLPIFLLFSFSSFSSFAVIDINKSAQTERTQNLQEENFSKPVHRIGRKKNLSTELTKIKKRKSRLRNFFKWKKKIKKSKIEDKRKYSTTAIISLILALIGSATFVIYFFLNTPLLLVIIFIISELAAMILGIVSLESIKKNSKKLRGKVFAWFGIILSGLWALLILVFIIGISTSF